MPDGERHQCVLCVDDNEAELYAVAKTLRDAGFDVCTAGSYFDALELLESPEQTIDVLLTDVVLNLGNGFALARIARRHRPDLKTVYVTAFDIPTVEAVGPVLRKPVSEPDIVETVRTAMTA